MLSRYRRRYATQDAAVAAFDAVLGRLVRASPGGALPRQPKRILVANAGHLGDAVVSTAILRLLKIRFPDASLGFLTGSYSRAVIEGHPLVDRAHYLDHWLASRSREAAFRKVWRYYAQAAPAMVRELRAARYDVALDLHAWLPNFVPLLWRAGIPYRVGFTRVGFAPLLTHGQAYGYDRRHELEHQLDLVRPFGGIDELLKFARPLLAPVSEAAKNDAMRMLGVHPPYRVLHPASSTATRDWTLEGWTALARSLLAQGSTPVVTGAGPRDQAMAEAICRTVPGAISAVNRLSWDQLMALLAAADVVYSVETSVGHAAAALGRSVVSIYGGMADPLHWGPIGARIVTSPMPCSPCFNKNGCAHRSCLMLTTAGDVEHAAAPGTG